MHYFVIYCIKSLYFLILLGFSMIMVGDVLLVNGNSKLSSGLIAAQKTIYLQSRSSHVGLFIGEGSLFMQLVTMVSTYLFYLMRLKKFVRDGRSLGLNISPMNKGVIFKSQLFIMLGSHITKKS